jgi:hypothetical protein
MNRVWVVPENDGEGVEIVRLLRAHVETVLVTGQHWGATWQALEPEIQSRLECVAPGTVVYGVELGGPNRYHAINIDHHKYKDEDRSNALSSLEQVAAILCVSLSRWQHLVAMNDKAWIPGMLADGASADEIEAVRQQDRIAQGLDETARHLAEDDLRAAEHHNGRVFVQCPRGINAFHSDLLFGKAEEWLLASPGAWLYSGSRVDAFILLRLSEAYWSGGSLAFGYFGVANPGADSQARMYSELLSSPH